MRNKSLDILRCAAVILVMCNHSGPHFNGIIPLFGKIGWAGVDLFFVLSGFLISGLLFTEYRRRQEIDIKRFLIRRGFKIYPSFYVFLLLAGLAAHLFSRNMTTTPAQYLHEAFFVQNYLPGVWGHTWSLAVEEHFYILLPLLLVVLALYSPNRENPFRTIPRIFLAVAVLSMASRAMFLMVAQQNVFLGLSYRATNSRMDALFFGVLLGYLHHFHPVQTAAFLERHRVIIAFASAGLLSGPVWAARESAGFTVLGLTGMYLGFGGLLMLCLYGPPVTLPGIQPAIGAVASGMAFLGMYSYSIYLWHSPVAFWTPAIAHRAFHVELTPWAAFFISLCASFVVGIAMARLIEFPVLHLRERFFPKERQVAAVERPSNILCDPQPRTTQA